MGIPDLLALAAVGAGLFFAVRGVKKSRASGCCGDCSRCGGCTKKK